MTKRQGVEMFKEICKKNVDHYEEPACASGMWHTGTRGHSLLGLSYSSIVDLFTSLGSDLQIMKEFARCLFAANLGFKFLCI